MGIKAKRITLYLGNGTLDGFIRLSESDGWDLGGELYSCPLDQINDLLDDDIIENKVGVYLLLSSNKVYIGQAKDLKSRTKQHLLDMDWWERIVVLTSDRGELNESSITYLESVLIQRAVECNNYEVVNKTKGNKHTLNKFETQVLNQYLDEAYFALELIGINAFKKGHRIEKHHFAVPPIIDKSNDERELRAKREAKTFLEKNGVKLPKEFSYAKLQENKNRYWINPHIKFLSEDWVLVLNNQIKRVLYILKVPKNTFKYGKIVKKGCLLVRNDRPTMLDLNLKVESLSDLRSKESFKQFVLKTIKY